MRSNAAIASGPKRKQVIMVLTDDPQVHQRLAAVSSEVADVVFGKDHRYLLEEQQEATIRFIDVESYKDRTELGQTIRQFQRRSVQFVLIAPSNQQMAHLIAEFEPVTYLLKPIRRKDVLMVLNLMSISDMQTTTKMSAMGTHFTQAEQRVLKLIAANQTTKSIATALHVSESTIKNHRHNISKKLKLSGDTHSLKNWVFRNIDRTCL